MARFDISEKAQADLAAIVAYTVERWGVQQADVYLAALDRCLSRLAEQPFLGHRRDELSAGLLSFPAESHIVYFLPTDFGIVVVRILHRRQDPHRHVET